MRWRHLNALFPRILTRAKSLLLEALLRCFVAPDRRSAFGKLTY
jgi:hypothetical protein